MSDVSAPIRGGRRDGGFTLTETVIAITLMGILMTTLAFVFSVIVRTTPSAEGDVTDARSLKGLVTWLPQDIDAAPPTGFVTDPTSWPCAGAAPADSHNVLQLTWVEDGATVREFNATYRYELDGGEWTMKRHACETSEAPSTVNLTSELPAWSTPAPVWVDMCSTAVDTSGACPMGSEVSDPTVDDVESLKLSLTLLDGSLFTIDAAAKNPDEELADDPDAVTNHGPTAGNDSHVITMYAGDTAVLDLYTTHAISDPEGDTLTSAVDSFEPMPAGISVTSSSPLQVSITADPSLSAGALTEPVALIVSDAFGGSVEITVWVEILPEPNDPPTATSLTSTVQLAAGETVIAPLDILHGLADPNDDDLSLDATSWPAPIASKPATGSPLGPLQMEVVAKSSVAVGVYPPITVEVIDEHGAFIVVQVVVEVIPAAPNNPPMLTSSNTNVDMYAGDTVIVSVDDGAAHGASDPDGDVIWVEVDPAAAVPAGLTVTTSGTQVTIEADPSIVAGPAGTVPLLVYDWHLATTPATVTVEILPTVPPPPDCVLGTLSVNPTTVSRSGGGGAPRLLSSDVLVTLTYSGSCDGLVLHYDTGHASGLGGGVGRVFPAGSPSSILLAGESSGGTEKWKSGTKTLTASTTSAVSPNQLTVTLTVT